MPEEHKFAIDRNQLPTHCGTCDREVQDGDTFVLYQGRFLCESCYEEERTTEIELFVRTSLDMNGFGDVEITKVEHQNEGA